MQITSSQHFKKRAASDLLVIPFWKTPKGVKEAGDCELAEKLDPIGLGDFEGKVGECTVIYSKGSKERRLLLLGLGKESELSLDHIRLALSKACQAALGKKWTKISLVVPHLAHLQKVSAEQCLKAMADGIFTSNYHFPKQKNGTLLKGVQWIGVLPKHLDLIKSRKIIADGVHLARDLTNESARLITPDYLANLAKQLGKAKGKNIKTTVLTGDQIHKEGLGLLEAVSMGASIEPRLIVVSYKGHPKSKDHTVFIGKGVTYDTGGLNLKPTGHMETMRADMAAGASVLATIATAADLKLPLNVTGVIPTTENAIGSHSFKPGDVFTAYDGTTVEIGNTDAEGRLILADAISYTLAKLNPTRMIDMATLTGSVVVALGEELAGLFTDDEKLATALHRAADQVGEPLWRMPLHEAYREKLKSCVADLSNVGGRAGGSITAALFLKHFATKKKVPWAHIDCAGPGFLDKPIREWPKLGVGFGVRLFIDFLESLNN